MLAAPAVLPARPPSLLPSGTVKHRLAQLPVDLVVRLAEPVAELISACSPDLLPFDVLLEVLSADPAGVELGKQLHEVLKIALLRRRRCLGICCGYGMEESPGAPTEGFDIGGTIVGRLRLLCFERRFGLGRPGREGGAGCAGAATTDARVREGAQLNR